MVSRIEVKGPLMGSPGANVDMLTGEETIGNYIHGGYGTYNKKPLGPGEILQLPQFTGNVRHRFEMRRRGKEVGIEPNKAFLQQFMQQKSAGTAKQTRKLVILPV